MIDAAGGKTGAIWRPGNGGDIASVALVDTDGVSGDGVPHLYYFIIAARGYEAAIRRPGHAIHAAEGATMEKACSVGDANGRYG